MVEVVPLHLGEEEALDRCGAVLAAGGTVVVPTDTVYGVAALPSVEGATAQLFRLKDRADEQPLAVLVADADQARALVDPSALTPEVESWMVRLWPGALTVVLPRSASALALELGGSPETVGVRCPANGFVRALAQRVGPIATTSANRHGAPTPATAADAAGSLAGPVGLVVDGGRAGTVASTVVDASGDPWRILRLGAITEDQLRHP